MKHLAILLFSLALTALLATTAAAEDRTAQYPVKHALESEIGQAKLLKDVRVYMKGQGHPGVQKRFREFKSNKRSNGLGKSDQHACDVAFISALIALQQRALKEGGNAVVDVYSITKDTKFESADSFSCVQGAMIANVALKGTVVKLGQ